MERRKGRETGAPSRPLPTPDASRERGQTRGGGSLAGGCKVDGSELNQIVIEGEKQAIPPSVANGSVYKREQCVMLAK